MIKLIIFFIIYCNCCIHVYLLIKIKFIKLFNKNNRSRFDSNKGMDLWNEKVTSHVEYYISRRTFVLCNFETELMSTYHGKFRLIYNLSRRQMDCVLSWKKVLKWDETELMSTYHEKFRLISNLSKREMDCVLSWKKILKWDETGYFSPRPVLMSGSTAFKFYLLSIDKNKKKI